MLRKTQTGHKRSRSLRKAASRPPLERMLQIHQRIQAGKRPTASVLARELEVSAKSIQRDIDFMRDRLNLPLSYDEANHGWIYTEDVAAFPSVQITEGELVALLVAEKALQQYRGTHFEKPLLSAFQKIASSLPDAVSINLSDWQETISFRTSAEPLLKLEIFDTLARAAVRQEQLIINYRKPGSQTPDERTVDPLHLANINGEWYLFAYDHGRKDMRTFVPSRMTSANRTGKTFTRPPKFSLESRLRNSFSVHSGTGEHLVVIRFNASVADYIREKKWHASQKMCNRPGGVLELRMTLSSLEEVHRWILSWGGEAEAIEPAELQQRLRTSARKLLGRSGA
ncbi:MAG: WYL domain-containing protein [Verrucomicrobia bacterium]|nr:WYL domain-containing protein [Verrucomicrobiota bacterium]